MDFCIARVVSGSNERDFSTVIFVLGVVVVVVQTCRMAVALKPSNSTLSAANDVVVKGLAVDESVS